MEKIESIKSLAEKYKEIFRVESGLVRKVNFDRYMMDFLLEFAGAVAHHLSSERAVEAEELKWCRCKGGGFFDSEYVCIHCGGHKPLSA